MVAVLPSGHANQAAVPGFSSSNQRLTTDDSHVTIRAALYAGVIGAVLGSIPIGPNFILAPPLAGFLAVLFFRRWRRGPEPRSRVGFKLGALAGVFSFPLFLVLTAIWAVTFHEEATIRQSMIAAVHLQQARATDPQVRQMLDYFLTPRGLMFMMGMEFVIMGIAFVLLSGIGAALGASFLRRKNPPER
ncbi:MAG TPA: hypothetical protein VJO35_12705 [Terriglobales bacterium]|nr:hypothetical protein [Terriglobales bacterium]